MRLRDHVPIKACLQIPARLHPFAPPRSAAFLVVNDQQCAIRQFEDRIRLAMQVDAMRLTGQPDLVTDNLCLQRQQMVAPAKGGGHDLALKPLALHLP